MRAICSSLTLLAVAGHAEAKETVVVPGWDGTPLATDICRKDNTPRPVQIIRGGGARAGTAMTTLCATAETGGAFNLVVQDTRGSGESQGTVAVVTLFNDDGRDGRALLVYIKSQPWSNGRVWMGGASNAGIVDYLAAPGADVTLRGISTSYATGDLLDYGLFNGGVLHEETGALVIGAGGTQWEGMSWQHYASLPIWENQLIDDAQASAANVIGLHRGGWFDVFGQGTLDTFSRLQLAGGELARGHQKVVIGPWTHGGGASTTVGELTFPSSGAASSPYPALSQAWQTGVTTGNWTTWNALAAVNVYVMGDADNPTGPGNRWRTFDRWPPAATHLPLYFTESRAIGERALVSSHVSFMSDPANPCPVIGGTNNLISCLNSIGCGPYDQRAVVESRSDVVVFTSAPTNVAAEIIGRIHADVWIATELPDVDIVVRMTDVYPDGRSMLMAQGIQRARYRNGTCPQLLSPGQPTLVRVDMSSTALALAVGHRLRVIVSATAAPLYAINPQNGDEYVGKNKPSRAGSIQILVGGDTASAIVVPVAGSGTPPDERPLPVACTDGGGDTPGGDFDPGPSNHAGCACRTGNSDALDRWFPLLAIAMLVFRRRRGGTRVG